MKRLMANIVLAFLFCTSLVANPRCYLFSDCLSNDAMEGFDGMMARKIEPFGSEMKGSSEIRQVTGLKEVWMELSKLNDLPDMVLICCQDIESDAKFVKRISKDGQRRNYSILWFTDPNGPISRFHLQMADYTGFMKRYPSADDIKVAEYLAESAAQWWTGMADNNKEIRRIPLWEGLPPQYEYQKDEMINSIGRIDYISQPEIEVFLPSQSKASPAIVFFPGGGLSYTGFLRNARELSAILNPKGIAVIGVKYRVKRGEEIAYEDACRAIRLVRAKAKELNINPDAVGVGGQSAGALLALHLTSRFDGGDSLSTDIVERQSCRPDFSVLLTSWNMGRQKTSFDFGAQTPPVFLRHAKNDSGFPLAKDIVKTLKSSGVSLNFRFVDGGGHGAFELEKSDDGYAWPQELVSWLVGIGLVDNKDIKVQKIVRQPVKIACIGNSITFGAGLKDRLRDSYPSVLSQMLGKGYEVYNLGVSGSTVLSKGDLPYCNTGSFRLLESIQPDIVILSLGTNDSKPHNWKYSSDLESDIIRMTEKIEDLDSTPEIYLCLPPAAYTNGNKSINDSTIIRGIIPVIRKVAEDRRLKLIDLHSASSGIPECFPDKIHPNREGSAVLAREVYANLTGKDIDFQLQDYPGVKSVWKGYEKYDFKFEGRDAIIVRPKQELPGKPWIFRPAFFGAFPSVDVSMLALGYHVLYYDVTFLYGSPRSQDMVDRFYAAMRRYYGFSEKVILEGFSRGGLFSVNWAARHPEFVDCIYLDAPVCDIFSWPGRQRAGLWKEFLQEWKVTEEDMETFCDNPLDNLENIARAGIPIIGVAGDSDKTVPFDDNLKLLEERFLQLGGTIDVIIKPGCDHHPHSLDPPDRIVELILKRSSYKYIIQ